MGNLPAETKELQKAFVIASTKREITTMIVVKEVDDNGEEVLTRQPFNLTRWTLSQSVMYEEPLQRIYSMIFSVMIEVSGVDPSKLNGETQNIEMPVKTTIENNKKVRDAIVTCWEDIMNIIVGTLYPSNADKWPDRTACRLYVDEKFIMPEIVELLVLIGTMNLPVNEASGDSKSKKDPRATLFLSVASAKH